MILDLNDVEIEVNMPIICFLQPEFWREFGYSTNNVKSTVQHFSSQEIWQSLLMLGAFPTQNAISISYSNPEAILFSNKASAIKKIMQFAPTGKKNILNIKSLHSPLLPFYTVDHTVYTEIAAIWAARTITDYTIHYKAAVTIGDYSYIPTDKVETGYNVVSVGSTGDEHPLLRRLSVGNQRCARGDRFFTVRLKDD